MRIILGIVFCLCPFVTIWGQNLYSLHTEWDDNIQQWEIIANEGEIEGEIEMTWRMRNDITEWSYRIDGKRGSIQQKWDNNRNNWELRSGSEIVNISTVWAGDFSTFRISNGDVSIRVERANFQNDPIEWVISSEKEGRFLWYNENSGDLRDWIIIDELSVGIPFEIKLAAVFVTVLFSFF